MSRYWAPALFVYSRSHVPNSHIARRRSLSRREDGMARHEARSYSRIFPQRQRHAVGLINSPKLSNCDQTAHDGTVMVTTDRHSAAAKDRVEDWKQA